MKGRLVIGGFRLNQGIYKGQISDLEGGFETEVENESSKLEPKSVKL